MNFKRFILRPESILLILLLTITTVFVWQKDSWHKGVLSSDGRGYYAYLPAIFIYQDLTYKSNSEAIEKQFGYEMGHHYIQKDKNGAIFNKCFPGVAICLSPLFLLAAFLSFLFGLDVNGYNDLFLIGIQLSAIIACAIGFFNLKKLLISYNIKSKLAIFVCFATVFGTNVYYYATIGACMGHIYSFMMIAVFLFQARKALLSNLPKHYYWTIFSLCLIFLIRPTNILVILLIPFLSQDWQDLKSSLLQWYRAKTVFFTTILIGVFMIAMLPFLWYVQTGSPLIWSYSNEGFYFLKPVPQKVLFDFRNGAFIYSPIAFVGMFGLIPRWRMSTFSALFGLLFFCTNLYLISAWWTFHYGGGFGHRALCEHHVFSGVLLGFLLQSLNSYLKKGLIILSSLLISLSLIQGYQTNRGILPSDYVNAEMYWHLFLKLDDKYIGECNATLDIRQYGEVIQHFYIRPNNFHDEPTIHFDESKEFGGDTDFLKPELQENQSLYLEYLFKKKRLKDEIFENVFLILEGFDESEKKIIYNTFNLYHIRNEALHNTKDLIIKFQLPKENIVNYKLYIWNAGHKTFDISDVDVRVLLIES